MSIFFFTGQLSSFATQGTSELSIIAVLLVRRLRVDVALNALLTEGVQTLETLGVLVPLQADLADEELVVNLLGQFAPRGTERTTPWGASPSPSVLVAVRAGRGVAV